MLRFVTLTYLKNLLKTLSKLSQQPAPPAKANHTGRPSQMPSQIPSRMPSQITTDHHALLWIL